MANVANALSLATSFLMKESSLLRQPLSLVNAFSNLVLPKRTVFDWPPPVIPKIDWASQPVTQWALIQLEFDSSPMFMTEEVLDVQPINMQAPASPIVSSVVPLLLRKAPVKKRDRKTVLYNPYRRHSARLQQSKENLDL
uniref:Uncharacterized protein n=1 Tax=Leersia perrieri TaxID=77586 RepID=A0A0D9W2P2_9ORYZ